MAQVDSREKDDETPLIFIHRDAFDRQRAGVFAMRKLGFPTVRSTESRIGVIETNRSHGDFGRLSSLGSTLGGLDAPCSMIGRIEVASNSHADG